MDSYNWPKGALLSVTDMDGCLLCQSHHRKFDLSDNLMLYHDDDNLLVNFSLSQGDSDIWGNTYLNQVESLIRYDLAFDGYKVDIQRLSEVDSPCEEEFSWQLNISVDEGDDDESE